MIEKIYTIIGGKMMSLFAFDKFVSFMHEKRR